MYGIDCDSALLRRRSWRWLRARIESLADRPATYVPYVSGEAQKFVVIPSTRLGLEMNPPVFE